MISIIAVLIITAGSYFYFHVGAYNTILLFIAGMCTAIGVNWFCRPKNVKGIFFAEDYILNHTARLKRFEEGDEAFGKYAKLLKYHNQTIVKILVEDKGQFKEKYVPNDFVSFSVAENGEEAAVKIYGASRYVWGNKAFSIFPGKAFSAKFHIVIKF